MKTFLATLLLVSTIIGKSFAFGTPPPDEGMWLPMLIKDYNYEEMKRLGCKLTPEQIYSVNQSSLKDAIVQLGGFCTAEIISDQGLIITNHHCGYDAIASQSTEEHNYLEDGFWAKTKADELPIEGLTVTFLVSMADVTERVNKAIEAEGDDMAKFAASAEIELIEKEYSEAGMYTVSVKEMFDGNAYYVFVYKIYQDIRLVGAPPSAIGKFGGDTDNWMWPRHTGDFSMMRIYSNESNEPADYRATNKALTPKHFLPVSTSGVSEGDFTMIMGFPGNTDRYLTSFEIKDLQEEGAPVIIDLLGKRLAIMKTEMDKSEAVKIKHASSRASLANTYKYYKGQLRGLKKFDVISQKERYEKSLMDWVNEDGEREKEYDEMLEMMKMSYASSSNITNDQSVLNMAGFAPEMVLFGIQLWRMKTEMQNSSKGKPSENSIEQTRSSMEEHFDGYAREMDLKMLIFALGELKNTMSEARRPAIFESDLYLKKAKGSNELFAQLIFKKSILTNEKKLNKFLAKPSLKVIENDPGLIFMTDLINTFRMKMSPATGARDVAIDAARKLYIKAIQEKESTKNFYPDANFTMRLTYGTVQAYNSWEGKPYAPFTYGSEILAKHKDGDEEFDVPDKLIELLKNKDYGIYANDEGRMQVCFLHNTDITGGNSGSPVINGDGELVGLAFDGNWESMTSDLVWDDDTVRTISVDIRYVLFIIDKFAGATHLVEEMKLVK